MQTIKLCGWQTLKNIFMHSTFSRPIDAAHEVYKQEICQFAKTGAMQLETHIEAVCTLNV